MKIYGYIILGIIIGISIIPSVQIAIDVLEDKTEDLGFIDCCLDRCSFYEFVDGFNVSLVQNNITGSLIRVFGCDINQTDTYQIRQSGFIGNNITNVTILNNYLISNVYVIDIYLFKYNTPLLLEIRNTNLDKTLFEEII